MNALISFKITDRPDLQFRPFAVDGTEGLSQLYKFDIDCFGDLAQRPDSLELIGKRAVLRFELEGAEPREIFGIIKTINSGAPSIYGDARYRFQLVPWLERLNYSRASQIHGTNEEVSVVDVIEAELRGGLRRETRIMDTDFRIFEHELRLKNRDSYPKRDHVVQADETDFAFISRMAEHHGIYYFFENTGVVEKVVFSDDNLFTRPIEGEAALDWKPWRAGSRAGSPDTIQEFDEITRMIPRRVWMLDYNYRVPHVPLLASAQIDSHGLGHWVEYGSHHRTPAEGETLARIRAEEMRSNQRRWTGKSAVARLSPGRSFKLHDHPYTDWNQEYLVVSVHHEVRVPMPGVELKEDWSGYRNSFEVIQQKTPFRPARITPKPRMDGLMNARIDGAGQRNKAELDDQGRYRVRVPFDNSDTPDGKGSQWVRMASPFGGDGDGMHFPLAPDTEVVIACVNGDPNRPVILGAVPNPRNKSVVTRENSLRNRMVTRTGMGFEMGADGNSGGRLATGDASSGNDVVTQNAYGRTVSLSTPSALGAMDSRVLNQKSNEQALEHPAALMAAVDAQEGKNYARLYADGKGYMRLGAQPPSGEPGRLTTPGVIGHAPIETIDWPELKTAKTLENKSVPTPRDVQNAKNEATSDTRAQALTDNMRPAGDPEPKLKKNSVNGEIVEGSVFSPSTEGIFSTTVGDLYTQVTGNAGLDVEKEIIFESKDNTTMTSKKSFYLSTKEDVQIISGGTLELYAVGDITIRSGGNVSISANGTMAQDTGKTDTETNFQDTTELNYGDSTEKNYANSKEYNYGISETFNLGLRDFSYTAGMTMSFVVGNETSVVGGSQIGIHLGALAIEVDAALVKLTFQAGWVFDVRKGNFEHRLENAEAKALDVRINQLAEVQANAGIEAFKKTMRAQLGQIDIMKADFNIQLMTAFDATL